MLTDGKLAAAVDALVKAGYALCTDPDCPELRPDRGQASDMSRYGLHLLPNAHFHVELERKMHVVSLLWKSRTLWWLPPLTLNEPGPDDKFFTLSNDPRLKSHYLDKCTDGYIPSGPWIGLAPVRILNHSSFIEAVLMHSMLWYKEDYTETHYSLSVRFMWEDMADKLVDANNLGVSGYGRGLREEFQLSWDCFCAWRRNRAELPHYYRIPLLRLRNLMIKTGGLPAELKYIDLSAGGFPGHDKVPTHLRRDLRY